MNVNIPVPVFMYRFFGESDDLLYIGITENLGIRLARHSGSQPWWPDVRRMTVEMLPNRPSAEAAEGEAIRAENPRYNKSKRAKEQMPLPTPGGGESVLIFEGAAGGRVRRRYRPSKVAADMRALIMSGAIPAGTPLPSIPVYAKRQGIATGTVQNAWQELKNDGLIESRAGVGVFVRDRQVLTSRGIQEVGDPAVVTRVLLELAEADAPSDVAESLGATRVLLHHYKTLRKSEVVGLTWSYYPLSLPGAASLAERVEPQDDAAAVLARIGRPARECVDEITARPPTTEEVQGLDMPASMHVIRQFREIYSDDLLPVAVSVVIKPGHLCEFEYTGKIPAYPAESLEIEEWSAP